MSNTLDLSLAKLVRAIVDQENEIELARVLLAQNPSFDPFQSFRRIDRSGNGYLSENDLVGYFKENSLLVSHDELDHLLTVAGNQNKKITYNDFLNQVLPCSDIDLRNKCLEKSGPFSFENDLNDLIKKVDESICNIFRKEIDYYRRISDLKRGYNHDLDDSFALISNPDTGLVNFRNVESFMKKTENKFTRDDYECFMRRLDKNKKGKVHGSDFRSFFTMSNKSVLAYDTGSIVKESIQSNLESKSVVKPLVQFESASKIISQVSPSFEKTQEIVVPSTSKSVENEYRASSSKDKSASKIANSQEIVYQKLPDNSYSPKKSLRFEEDDRKIRTIEGRSDNPESDLHQDLRMYKTVDTANLPSNVRSNIYEDQITSIRTNPAYQTVSDHAYQSSQTQFNPANTESRFNDPAYHSYWNYSKDHNYTLKPNVERSKQFPEDFRRNGDYELTGTQTTFSNYYNPSFVDQSYKPDMHRYKENPFKYTDHAHYFKNFYSNLRSNYYDKHYKSSPERMRYQYSTREAFEKPEQSYKRLNETYKSKNIGESSYANYPTKYTSRNESYVKPYNPSQTYQSSIYMPPTQRQQNVTSVSSNFQPYKTFDSSNAYTSRRAPIQNRVPQEITVSSSTYTPNSKRETTLTAAYEKPKSAIKIEESRPISRTYESGTSKDRAYSMPRETGRIEFESKEDPSDSIPVEGGKAYKFANNQFENLWKNEEEL